MTHFISILFIAVTFLISCNSDSSGRRTETASVAPSVSIIHSLRSSEIKTLRDEKEVIFLDVRTLSEYSSGHIREAVHLDFYAEDFSQRLEDLDRSQTYVVYCAVGGRSNKAVRMMKKMGFKEVYDASEGFATLKSSGIPAE